MKKTFAFLLMLVLCFSFTVAGADQFVYEEGYPIGAIIGDAVSGAPVLGYRGEYAIGVRTIEVVNPEEVDLANITEANPRPLYDRKHTLEVWYPAKIAEGAKQLSSYTDYIGRIDEGDLEAFDYMGRAMRDAEPYLEGGPYPVIVVSHGYPGNRYLMSWIGENMATKGYVVIAIDHTDSTYTDFNPAIAYTGSIINRTVAQRFVIGQVEVLNADGWLKGMMNPEKIGLVGYSFGGYGALRTIGAKLSEGTLTQYAAYADLLTEAEDFKGDERVDAAVLFAPWGRALFDLDSFANITTPTLWIQGNADQIVPYAGVREMFAASVNTDRYYVTYELLNHSASPNPTPLEAHKRDYADARRWADGVWDNWRLNGYNAHFLTAFFDAKLKGDEAKMDYLNVKEEIGRNVVYSTDPEKHTYWPGFEYSTPTGIIIEHVAAK